MKGILRQRGSNVAQGQGATGEAIGAVIQGANELSTPDFNKKMFGPYIRNKLSRWDGDLQKD